jgi:hypothetical protein
MNFTGAIQAHTNWKLRLAAQCQAAASNTIDVQALAKDDVCELGKWLYGAGRKLASDPKFKDLVDGHARFHKSAAAIAVSIQQGKKDEALALIQAPDSEFGKLSLRVCKCLMDLRAQHGDS